MLKAQAKSRRQRRQREWAVGRGYSLTPSPQERVWGGVTCFYIVVARNWSHNRRTGLPGPKIEARKREWRWTFWGGANHQGAALIANAFWP